MPVMSASSASSRAAALVESASGDGREGDGVRPRRPDRAEPELVSWEALPGVGCPPEGVPSLRRPRLPPMASLLPLCSLPPLRCPPLPVRWPSLCGVLGLWERLCVEPGPARRPLVPPNSPRIRFPTERSDCCLGAGPTTATGKSPRWAAVRGRDGPELAGGVPDSTSDLRSDPVRLDERGLRRRPETCSSVTGVPRAPECDPAGRGRAGRLGSQGTSSSTPSSRALDLAEAGRGRM